MNKPIVWTIAGSDSGGGAGIQADIKTFQALGVYGCSIITAITAQNSYEVLDIDFSPTNTINAQIAALEKDLPPKAIKLGMLGPVESLRTIASFLSRYRGYVVCDPVMVSTSGASLLPLDAKEYFIKEIIPYADLLTPNLLEAGSLLNCSIQNADDVEKAAQRLLNLGAQNVLIKGGHGIGGYCQDYWTNGKESFWLTIERRSHANNHGSGCTLSAAIAACIGLGYSLQDSLVIAKSYVSQGIRMACQYGQGPGPVAHYFWPTFQEDLPWITQSAHAGTHRPVFVSCNSRDLGFYPIVNSGYWLEQLLATGVKTLQLRIKDKQGKALEEEIKQGVKIARKYNARLFINDYWELAIAHNAYGVHLGQEDLVQADCAAIAQAGLRLGISTHCYYEVARAHALQPSYIACGPIFPTNTKKMPFLPQGIINLKHWRKLLNYPLVAIGGISLDTLEAVLACGVEGIAVISAVLNHPKPQQAAAEFLEACEKIPLILE
jgi:hydroxymethylpyrimidine kinase/phosphomethylpyrimidine kinase/thiamine-phosphate diphosphorylase